MTHRSLMALPVILMTLWLGGCAAPAPRDQTALRAARPASILVLPPLNTTHEVTASSSLLAVTTRPLAETGYYVMPVSLVDETFRQNGVTQAEDIHALPLSRLQEFFQADAVLYLTVTRYGATYYIVSSTTTVKVQARLVDGRTGQLLWEGQAQASSDEGKDNSNQGLVGLLLSAVIQQVASHVGEQSHQLAGVAAARLFSVRGPNALLPGPRYTGQPVP